MTNSPDSGDELPSHNKRFWLILLSRPVIGSLVALLAILLGAGWWAWFFINRELAPLVEESLSQTLNRPVHLGRLSRFSLTGLRFGSSSIPAFTKRVGNKLITDADHASVRAVEVGFNPLALLLTRTLNLDVALVRPDLYLDQAKDGRWLLTPIRAREEEEGLIKIKLSAIRFQEANAVIAPRGISPRTFREANGKVLLLGDKSQELKFDLATQATTGGDLKLEGEWFRPSQQIILTAQAQDLTPATLRGLAKLPLNLQAGLFDGKFKAQFNRNQQPDIEGTAWIKSATVVIPAQYLLKSRRPAPLTFRSVNGTAQLLDRSRRVQFDLRGQVAAGGNFNLKGQWLRSTQQANVDLRVQNLAAKILDGAFGLPVGISAGQINSNLNIQLRPNQRPSVKGTARLNDVTARIAQLPRSLTNVTGQLRFSQGLVTTLENVRSLFGKIPIQISGSIDPDRGLNLAGQTEVVRITDGVDTFGLDLPLLVSGSVQGRDLRITGPFQQPVLSGAIAAVQTAQIDRVDFSSLMGRFELKAPVLTFSDLQATPVAGGIITGRGLLNLRAKDKLSLNLQVKGVPGDPIARVYGASPGIRIGPVFAQARVSGPPGNIQTLVQWQTPRATYPGTGEILVSGSRTLLRNIALQVAGGTVNASGRIAAGQWQAAVAGSRVQLRQFSPALRGLFSGRLNLSGTLASFKPAAIRAQGRVRFSQGVSLIEKPLTASIQWDGEKILVNRATAPGLRADGAIFAKLQGSQAPEISGFNLNVQAQDYSLQALQIPGPTRVNLQGQADFTGRLTGTPTAPNARGALRLNNFVLNQVAFEPTLTGRVSYSKRQGVDLQLAGNQDRINVALSSNFRPQSFYVRQDEAIAQGQTRGENLLIDLQRFPLAILNLNLGPQFGPGPATGLASGDFNFNLRTATLFGNVAIARPQLGTFEADQFTGQLQYANGVARLSGGRLQQKDSEYLISGTFQPGADPRFAGQVQVARAEVQDVLTALKYFNLEDLRRGFRPPDYAKAAAVRPRGVGMPEATLETQLRRLSEVEALLAQQVARRESASPLPNLAELQGSFGGRVAFSGSRRSGITADFDLQGQEFNWGPYQVDQLIASGSFKDGELDFRPLRLQSGESLVAFAGQVGEEQAGQLQLKNVPVETLQDFVNLPTDFTGRLNGTATLSGSLADPQATGQLSLVAATINQKPVKSAVGNFSYNDARLAFDSTVIVSAPEPVQIAGSIPYQLPFASASPSSNQISLDVNVKNEGLALLSLFTPQVAWVNGTGQANLQVRGTLEQPLADGIVTAANATIRAQALPQPLTNVNGIIRFSRDRVRVEQFTGQFSQGQVVASGVIPLAGTLSPSDPDRATPLTIRSDKLALNLPNRYVGGVNSNLILTGSVLSPELGGAIQLIDGQVLLTSTTSPPPARLDLGNANAAGTGRAGRFETSPLQFNDLRVSLGDNVQVTRPPILNFLASGNLTLNGPVNSLRPQGTIQLQRGQVNVFTTRFRLDRGEPNFVTFVPNQGLDPNLNITLRTTTSEVTSSRTSNLNEFGDASATSLGSVDSVRIQAQVTGRASQVINDFENNVELTSSPFRSQDEILALLGGGFSDTNGEEDSTLALANLAGSAFFSNVQGLFGDLQDRIDFRLFPTLTPSDETRSSTLELGAELGYDVTRRFSVSVLQVLTNPDEPTQLNLRYDLSDQIQLRGGTNIQGESVGAVEYRTRF